MSEEAKPKYKRPRTEAQRAGEARYHEKNIVHISLNLNRNTDADIIKLIEMGVSHGESVQGFIKAAIRYAAGSICID